MTGALIYTEDCSGAGARMQTQKSWPGLGLGDAGPRKMSVIYCLVNFTLLANTDYSVYHSVLTTPCLMEY